MSSRLVLVGSGSDSTVPRIRVDFVLRAIAAIGHPPEFVREIANAVGLGAEDAADPHDRVALSQLDALYEEGARRTGDDSFGLHAAERTHPTMLDVAGYALIHGPNLAQGFQHLRPYLTMLHGPEELTLSIESGRARFSYATTDARCPPSRHRCEAYLGIVLRIARVALGGDEHPSAVAFAHGAPPDTSEHRRIFGAPVCFDCSVNEICFEAALLERPLRASDPSLWALLDRYSHELSLRAPPNAPHSTAANVGRLLPLLLAERDLAMSRVARQLRMSTRTLQRRLQSEGTSYQAIVDETRRKLALRQLRESEVPIGDIAARLGYATVSAFYDAFHRWTKLTPRDYRRAQGAT